RSHAQKKASILASAFVNRTSPSVFAQLRDALAALGEQLRHLGLLLALERVGRAPARWAPPHPGLERDVFGPQRNGSPRHAELLGDFRHGPALGPQAAGPCLLSYFPPVTHAYEYGDGV